MRARTRRRVAVLMRSVSMSRTAPKREVCLKYLAATPGRERIPKSGEEEIKIGSSNMVNMPRTWVGDVGFRKRTVNSIQALSEEIPEGGPAAEENHNKFNGLRIRLGILGTWKGEWTPRRTLTDNW